MNKIISRLKEIFGMDIIELIYRDAPKASGGVGILVKQTLSEQHNMDILDKSYDALRFINRSTQAEFPVLFDKRA